MALLGVSDEVRQATRRAVEQGGIAAYWRQWLELADQVAQEVAVPSSWMWLPCAAVGDLDSAFAWLERDVERRAEELAYLKVSPFFDPLRDHPRFGQLLGRIQLARARGTCVDPKNDPRSRQARQDSRQYAAFHQSAGAPRGRTTEELAMFDRSATRPRTRLGYGTTVIALATLVTAVSMFFASAVDVRAMLRPDQAAARAMGPVEIPQEWVWRGRAPINLDSMYANRKPAQPDWIRMHRSE